MGITTIQEVARVTGSAHGCRLGGAEMEIDFAEVLEADGRAERLGPAPHGRARRRWSACAASCARSTATRADLEGHARHRLRDPVATTSASGSRRTGRSTSPTRCRATGRFRVNAYMQRASVGAAFRLIPVGDQVDRPARPAAGDPRLRQEAARLRARHGADRFRQVHVAGGDDRRDQQARATSTSSRSRTRSSSCTATRTASSTSARSATTRRASRSA